MDFSEIARSSCHWKLSDVLRSIELIAALELHLLQWTVMESADDSRHPFWWWNPHLSWVFTDSLRFWPRSPESLNFLAVSQTHQEQCHPGMLVECFIQCKSQRPIIYAGIQCWWIGFSTPNLSTPPIPYILFLSQNLDPTSHAHFKRPSVRGKSAIYLYIIPTSELRDLRPISRLFPLLTCTNHHFWSHEIAQLLTASFALAMTLLRPLPS